MTRNEMSRSQMIDWINEAVWIARIRDEQPNHDAIIAAVLAGDVRPDDNDGSITDETEALLFGALVSGDERFWSAV